MIQSVRDSVQILVKKIGINSQRHGCTAVAEHPLDSSAKDKKGCPSSRPKELEAMPKIFARFATKLRTSPRQSREADRAHPFRHARRNEAHLLEECQDENRETLTNTAAHYAVVPDIAASVMQTESAVA